MELMILDKFEWNVNDITAADFLSIFQSLIINKYLAHSRRTQRITTTIYLRENSTRY